jgi:glycosyltransferase involved in cell wall biosynthesis
LIAMRLLHLYAGNLYGGIERMLATVAQHAHLEPRLQHEFAFCFDGKIAGELRAAGAAVHLLGPVRFSRPWTLWRARRNLRRLLAAGRYDAAICHACWPHAAFAAAVRRAGVPLVFWAHDAMRGDSRFERKAAKTPPDLVIANSRFSAGLVPNVFPTAPTRVIYCPTSNERTAGPISLDSVPLIVICCRFERWKGHALLLSALQQLAADGVAFRCAIAGRAQRPAETEYLAELHAQAAAGGIAGQIDWLGHVDDVPSLLARARVHCQPNTGPEPFGIAFIEALAAGVPVVTTRLGAAPEIVVGDVGELVEPDNPAALASALRRWLDRPADPALADRCRARARALCDPARQLEALYTALLGVTGAERSAPGRATGALVASP